MFNINWYIERSIEFSSIIKRSIVRLIYNITEEINGGKRNKHLISSRRRIRHINNSSEFLDRNDISKFRPRIRREVRIDKYKANRLTSYNSFISRRKTFYSPKKI